MWQQKQFILLREVYVQITLPKLNNMKLSLLAQEVWGLIPEPMKLDSVANGSPPLRRLRIAQAFCHGDRPRHSLHASA